ncbi:hypothetical protein [Paenibacillus sp. S150]|uniref:hypothetical protein n=1 Tax=Paenibacillus sp. S150 TaxID=2749826 RepID=UPI001C56FB6C|nr:hypothetical protein [Paenibacillus sp. S150]MBW4080404.1 hypothetical protein [Paenibacillus sp. S150]
MQQIVFHAEQVMDDELRRIVGFASEEILSIRFVGKHIQLTVQDGAEVRVLDNIHKLVDAYNRVPFTEEEVLYAETKKKQFYSEEELLASDLISRCGEGLISLNGVAARLYQFLDECFIRLLEGYHPQLRKFPVLLPLETYASTKYLTTSPQYAMFCCSVRESILEVNTLQKHVVEGNITSLLTHPQYAFSPSACFHLYEELRGSTLPQNSVYTFRQNVFRNEGRFNWGELERLRDYTVREIVFIGDEDYVYGFREELTGKLLSLLRQLGLDYEMKVGSDPFIIPEMQKYKALQTRSKVKYELKVAKGRATAIACASLNLHGVSFANSFGFEVLGTEPTVSGCVGFGLERWVLAFLSQYGNDVAHWPDFVQQGLL